MKAKKVLLFSLSLMLASSALAGCNFGGGTSTTGSGDNSSQGTSGDSSSSVNEKAYTSLPDEEWEPETLVSNGEALANYKIVIPAEAGASVAYAAELLQKHIKEATSLELSVVTDAAPEGEHEILIGNTARKEDDDVDFAALGKEAFVVKSVGKDLVIAGNERGSLYGVYEYLEALGYRFYAPAGTLRSETPVNKIPKAKDVFVAKDVELTWTPQFDYREVLYRGATTLIGFTDAQGTYDWCVAQRVNSDYCRPELKSNEKYGGSVGYIGGNNYMVHSARSLLPYTPSMYAQHPDWFASKDGQLLDSGTETEPCWTNEDALDYMYEKMQRLIATDSDKIISLSMNDTHNYCQCETCSAEQAEYGVSGWFFRAVNKIAKRLKVDHPDVKLDTIAYAYATEAPDIVMEDNVIVRLCLATCRWHTDEEECAALDGNLKEKRQSLLDWQDHASEFYVYHYPINWANHLTIDPSYQSLYANTRFFAEHGVKGMYCEGYVVENGEFSELKAYLTAKLLANPTMSYGEFQYHMRDFLEGYYGDGWECILEYINLTYDIIMTEMADSNYHLPHWYGYEENFPFDNYYDYEASEYDMRVIDKINDLWAEAEEMATPEQADRIRKSSIHWTYLELYNTFDKRYKNPDNREELVEKNEQLFNDMMRLGVTQRNAEGPVLANITNFTRSPATWFSK